MGATYVGVRRAHPYSWLLSSPQQPLETADPPTVSLAPQYTSQQLCRAITIFLHRKIKGKVSFCSESVRFFKTTVQVLHAQSSKIFSLQSADKNFGSNHQD